MDFNKLIARVKAILLTPKTEWPAAASEPATVGGLYKNYIVIVAAIPALVTLLIMLPFSMGFGLRNAVMQYVVSLAIVYLAALVIEALAPTFGGQKDRIQALKTVTYSMTAGWIASIGTLIPNLGVLIGLAGAIYGIYLLYLGLPHTMKCPPEKAGGYTAAIVVIFLLIGIVLFAIFGRMIGGGMLAGGTVIGSTQETQFDKDSPLGKLEKWSKEVEEAGKKMEATEKSGDQNAQADALKQMMGAALGGGQVESLPTDRLRPFVPESLAGLPRTDFSVERNNAMGLQITEAKATYANADGRTLNLEITDAGTAKGLLAFAGWSGLESESESSSGYEKTYREDGRLIHEEWDREGSYGQYAVVLGDRFTVQLNGAADSINELKSALTELDLGELEALKNEGVKR